MKSDQHLGDLFHHKGLATTIEERQKARSELLADVDAFISEGCPNTPSE